MKIKIKNKIISEKSKTFVVGEIGLNHDGKIKNCIKLIDHAKKAGFDAIKLQISDPNESYYPKSKSHLIFKKNSLTDKQLEKVVYHAKKKKIIIFSTYGDIKSLYYQDKFNFPLIKISSGLITNIPLIKRIAKKNKPIILSTGMAFFKEIQNAIKTIKKINKKGLILLVCTSLYPCDDKYVNLSKIQSFRKKFNLLIGYSDHTIDNLASVSSVFFGANVIEKHITLKKKNYGDHLLSADKYEMVKMIKNIRRAETLIGNNNIFPNKKEIKLRGKVLRKIVSKKKILKNEKFSLDNISLMRHEKNFPFELDSKNFDKIIGKKNKKALSEFKVLTKKNISI